MSKDIGIYIKLERGKRDQIDEDAMMLDMNRTEYLEKLHKYFRAAMYEKFEEPAEVEPKKKGGK